MRITRRQLRRIIREDIEVHRAPENLEYMDPMEAYGLGYDAAWQIHAGQDAEGEATYLGVIKEVIDTPSISKYLIGHGYEEGIDYTFEKPGRPGEEYAKIDANTDEIAFHIYQVLDPSQPYEGNPFRGSKYNVDNKGNIVTWQD